MMSLEAAISEALGATDGTPDRGAAELALTYARAIDQGKDLDRLGPQLLAVLESLLLTPKARAALVKGAKNADTKSPVDELRARRAARQRDPQTVHAAAS